MGDGGTLQAFIDESKRSGQPYIICAVTICSGDINTVRKGVKDLLPKGATRIHMCDMRANEQMPIVNGVAELGVTSRLFMVRKQSNERQARDAALSSAFLHLDARGVRRATIESCDQDHEDNRVIRQVLGKNTDLQYRHELAKSATPLLWIPDVHAWAWGKGGRFRKAIEPQITIENVP